MTTITTKQNIEESEAIEIEKYRLQDIERRVIRDNLEQDIKTKMIEMLETEIDNDNDMTIEIIKEKFSKLNSECNSLVWATPNCSCGFHDNVYELLDILRKKYITHIDILLYSLDESNFEELKSKINAVNTYEHLHSNYKLNNMIQLYNILDDIVKYDEG
jgi:hypothetical protein